MPRKCAMKGCKESTKCRKFSFPPALSQTDRFLKWLAATGRTDYLSLSPEKIKEMRVCEQHFEKKYMLNSKLTTTAVPTLLLPEEIDVSSYGIVETENPDGETPLSFFELTKKGQLSPEERKLYNTITQLRKSARQAQKRYASVKLRIEHVEKLVRKGTFSAISELPETSKKFLQTYFRNLKQPKNPREYTKKDKIFALALYKRDPSAYVFLRDIFSLPSVSSLRALINRIPTQPGFCPFIFDAISEKIRRLKHNRAKYCILTFDETSLEPSLTYNPITGTVDGFVDNGYEREPQIADRAIVWILKSVQGTWQQPIWYSFCHSTEKSENIVRTFRDIVREANKHCLSIVSLICDQTPTNVRAIESLIEISKLENLQWPPLRTNDNIIIDGQIVVPLFDPPHLMMAIRNNFLTKNVRFKYKGRNERVAKWPHIVTAYEIDKSAGHLRAMRKLTDEYVYVDKIDKTKTNGCNEVFSHTVAAVMHLMSRSCTKCVNDNISMPTAAIDTARFVQLMDKLFESVNCDSTKTTQMPTLKSEWNEFITAFRTMIFVKSRPSDRQRPSVLNNWIKTLEAFKYLKSYLGELGFKYFSPRIFNQEAVETLFGQIKLQQGTKNSKPTCSQFEFHFKTLLLNNLYQKNRYYDCEDDESSDFLTDLETMINATVPDKQIKLLPVSKELEINRHNTFEIEFDSFARSIQASVGDCEVCAVNVSPDNNDFLLSFDRMTELIINHLSRSIHVQKCGKTIMEDFKEKVIFNFQNCEHEDELINLVVKTFVDKTIERYLGLINTFFSECAEIETKDTLMRRAREMNEKEVEPGVIKIEPCDDP